MRFESARRMRRASAAVLVAASIVAAALHPSGRAAASVPADLPSEALATALAQLDRLDRTRYSIDVREGDLEDVLASIDAAVPDLEITAEWAELGRVGARRHTPITLRIEDGSVLTVLAALATRLGDEYARPVVDSDGTRVLFTTRDRSAEFRMTGAYDVRDLVGSPQVLGRIGVGETEAEAEDAAAGDPGAGDDDAAVPGGSSATRELAELLVRHADAEAWLDLGGTAGRISAHDGRIVVTAPPSVHRAIARMLEALRRTTPTGVDVEAMLVRAPAEAWAAVRASAGGGEPRPLDVLAEPGAGIVWTAAMPLAVDAEGRVSGVAGDGSLAAQLELSLARRPGTGDLRLTVDARITPADGSTQVSGTTADLPRGFGELLLETPGPGGTVRLLVLRVDPRFAGR